MYGVVETNPLIEQPNYDELETVYPEELLEQGGRFTRIRLLTDRGYPYLDVSYIRGSIKGKEVRVAITFDTSRLGRRTYRSDLQNALIRDCGYSRQDCNRMGIWQSETYSILYG